MKSFSEENIAGEKNIIFPIWASITQQTPIKELITVL